MGQTGELPILRFGVRLIIDAFQLEWTDAIFPSACLPSYHTRLLLLGLGPLALLAAVFAVCCVYHYLHSVGVQTAGSAGQLAWHARVRVRVGQSLLNALPVLLFFCFCGRNCAHRD